MLLLVTGCIRVNKDMPYVTVNNLRERLDAYCETIRWAIEETSFSKIVFCENSNYDFDCLKYENMALKKNKEFEYLTFQGNNELANKKGKGYGEGEIVLYALKKSKLLRFEDYFCKITGRLKISNVNNLIKNKQKNFFMGYPEKREVDTRFYGISKKIFLENLKNSYQNVDDSNHFYLEHAYYEDLDKNKVQYRNFYQRPLFEGASGSTGLIYSDKRKKYECITTFLYYTNFINSKFYWKLRRFIR